MLERVGGRRKVSRSRDGEDLLRGQNPLGVALTNRETDSGDDPADRQMVEFANVPV